MNGFKALLFYNLRRRAKDSFLIGYHIIFPIVLIVLLGYLFSESYDNKLFSFQYYSIVILPFCNAMAMITAAYHSKEEAYHKTSVRFLASPISYTSMILSKLLSGFVIIACCNLLVLILARIFFKIPIIENVIPVVLLILAECFTVYAMGLLIGFGSKNFMLIKNLLNIPICLFAVLAGTFFPFASLNPVLEFFIRLSPLYWINRGIFLAIYDGHTALLWRTTRITSSIGVIVTILAIRFFKKEEFIHGDLPGYEK